MDTQTESKTVPTFDLDAFLKVFKEFSIIEADTVQFYGDITIDLLDPKAWGDKWYMRGVYLLTAHVLAMRYPIDGYDDEQGNKVSLLPGNDTVQITSKSAGTGSLSESGQAVYKSSTPSAWLDTLAQTRYGLQLLALIEILFPCGHCVISRG